MRGPSWLVITVGDGQSVDRECRSGRATRPSKLRACWATVAQASTARFGHTSGISQPRAGMLGAPGTATAAVHRKPRMRPADRRCSNAVAPPRRQRTGMAKASVALVALLVAANTPPSAAAKGAHEPPTHTHTRARAPVSLPFWPVWQRTGLVVRARSETVRQG